MWFRVTMGQAGLLNLRTSKWPVKPEPRSGGRKRRSEPLHGLPDLPRPTESPRYAFAALYEGAPGEMAHGGTVAAPMIGELLRELFKGEAAVEESSAAG